MKLKNELDKARIETAEEAYKDLMDSLKLGRSRDDAINKLSRHYQEETIELSLKLHSERSKYDSESSILKGERYKELLNWYVPVSEPASSSGWGKLISVLIYNGWSQEDIKSLDNQSNSVVANLAPPKSETRYDRNLWMT